jgi:uncharacterized protein
MSEVLRSTTAEGGVADINTYLLIDGENLDATLGGSILGRRPAPEERPRWERVVHFAERLWGHPVKALFFINASSGHLPTAFVQALLSLGLRPVLLSGSPGVKVVDVGIQRTLDALARRPGDVLLGSHDVDFFPEMQKLLGNGRNVALLAFREFVNARYEELLPLGLRLLDLEDDARCFNQALPRVRIVDIDAFDPEAYL